VQPSPDSTPELPRGQQFGIGTLRFLGVLPFLGIGHDTASNFFIFQFGIGALELLVLRRRPTD
jgi:hypothetical protein